MTSPRNAPVWRFLGDISIPGPSGDLGHRLGKKPLALLAYLALTREGASRDELASLLWPDPDPSRSKHNLRQCLLSLRKAFGADAEHLLDVGDDWVALREGVAEIDVRRLVDIDTGAAASAEELLDLGTGPFLRAFTTRAGPFDEWAAERRVRLAATQVRAIAAAHSAAQRAGRHDEAARLAAALMDLGAQPDELAGARPPALPAVIPPAPARRRWWPAAVLIAVGACIAVAGLAATYYACVGCRDWIDARFAQGDPTTRIAVRPFTTANGTQGEEGLAGGVTLGVTYALYAISDKDLIVVTPPPDAEDLKQMERIALAKRLGVRYLISGSVTVEGSQVRVDVQCLDAETGIDVWQDRFDQPYAEAFKLQDAITRRIVSGLNIPLSSAESNRIQYLDDTDDLLAWLYAADGVRHLIRVTREDAEQAKQLYNKALERSPGYTSAQRGLAWVAFLEVRLGWASDPMNTILEAENWLNLVLAKKPDDGMSLSLKGAILLLKGQYDQAEEAGKLATRKLPGSADVWAVYAHTLTYLGRPQEALDCIAKAMELSVLHPAWYAWTRGRALRLAGRFDESVAVLEGEMRSGPRTLVLLAELTASYAAAGRMIQARATAKRILAAAPEFTATKWLDHPRIAVREIQTREFGYLSSALH